MIYKFKENRVWRAYTGGRRLDNFYGKQPCKSGRMPEEWLASTTEAFNPDRLLKGEGLSVCEDGRIFRDVLSENPEKILGKALCGQSILVKLLDSDERLAIQCHPTADFAKKHFGSRFGKTECWYMLNCGENACVYLGFKPGITKKKWKNLFEKQDIDGMLDCLHKFQVKPGELWFVNGGMPHAIGGGCFMIELQEPTDLMVIPEKVTPAGIPLSEQKLHGGLGFDKMFDCFDYTGYTKEEIKHKYYRKPVLRDNKLTEIVGKELTESFSMEALRVNGVAKADLGEHYAVAVVTEGIGKFKTSDEAFKLKKSSNFFISADSGSLEFSGDMELIFCIA